MVGAIGGATAGASGFSIGLNVEDRERTALPIEVHSFGGTAFSTGAINVEIIKVLKLGLQDGYIV